MVVNYHALNKQRVKSHYLLPGIDDLYDQLRWANVFLYLYLAQ